MSRRPRVTYLSTTSGGGGAERQVHDLAIRLADMGWDVSAVSMLPLDVSFEGLPEAGVAVGSLGMRQGRPDPRALYRLARVLRERRPDVLHAHMVHAILLARLSRFAWRTPVVVSTMHSQYQGAAWRMVAYRATDRLSDATTSVSDVARRDAIRHGAVSSERIVTVPNGIDLGRYAPDAGGRARVRRDLGLGEGFVWLAVGRLTVAKDYPNLIRAFALLQQAGARSRLLIAGTGLEEGNVRSMIEAAGLGGDITLLGTRSDVPDLMRAADGFVMSSAWEGLPLVILEAAASSLPIVATDAGGNREAVLDGKTGFIVRPKDDRALADGMRRLLDLDAGDRRELGQAGRRHVVDRL